MGYAPDQNDPSLFTLDRSTGAPAKVADHTIGGEISGFGAGAPAIPHPCAPPPPPPAPAVVITPRFTG